MVGTAGAGATRKLPGVQFVAATEHAALPGSEKVFSGQAPHTQDADAPTLVDRVLTGHSVHADWPVKGPYEPAGQLVHAATPKAAEKRPGWHWKHELLPVEDM